VHYILTPEAIGEQKKIVFYYLVSLHLPYSEVVTGNCSGARAGNCGLWQQALNTFPSSFVCSFPTNRRVWLRSRRVTMSQYPWVSTGILLQGGTEQLSGV